MPSQAGVASFNDRDFWGAPQIVNPQATSYSSDAIFTSPTTGVNPTLLSSFSSPPQAFNPSSVHQDEQLDVGFSNKQPYEHQMKDASREKELARKAKMQQNRSNTMSSSLTATARPGLHRSNTDSGFRRMKNRSLESRASIQNSEAARKPSPLKRLSQASLSSIPESSRPLPRTRLVIDEDGNARTETDSVEVEEPRSHWDDLDSDDDEEIAIPSGRNSFANPAELTRSSKHARNDSGDQSFGASKRPLSSASIASLTSRFESTPLGKKNLRDSTDSSYRRFSMGSMGSSQGQLVENNDDVFMEEREPMDARDALKKLVESRGRLISLEDTRKYFAKMLDPSVYNTMPEEDRNWHDKTSQAFFHRFGIDPKVLNVQNKGTFDDDQRKKRSLEEERRRVEQQAKLLAEEEEKKKLEAQAKSRAYHDEKRRLTDQEKSREYYDEQRRRVDEEKRLAAEHQ